MSRDDRNRGSGRRGFLTGAMATTAIGLLPAKAALGAEQVGHDVKAYKTLGRTALRISDISFGSSRLRTGEEDLVKYALDRGVNYFDTAESYTDGASETVLGNALHGKRDKVYVVSKVSAGASERKESMMSALEGSLGRLQTDYVDIYFNHAVNDIARLDNPEWREFTESAKKQGKIRFVGMSGHAGNLIGCLDHAIDIDSVDAVLVAYNFGQDPKFSERLTRSFAFVAVQPDLPRVLAKAKAKNVGVVTMKTLMGARLNDLRSYETGGATFAQAAFRWTLSNAHVDGLVVSMTSQPMIDEYLGASGATDLAHGDFELLRQYALLNGASYCRHACNACEGACPFGVPIADVLRTRMYATDYGDVAFARREYAALDGSAEACLSCTGQPCQGACPHGLQIEALCGPTHRILA